jgi:hypothetical protein
MMQPMQLRSFAATWPQVIQELSVPEAGLRQCTRCPVMSIHHEQAGGGGAAERGWRLPKEWPEGRLPYQLRYRPPLRSRVTGRSTDTPCAGRRSRISELAGSEDHCRGSGKFPWRG